MCAPCRQISVAHCQLPINYKELGEIALRLTQICDMWFESRQAWGIKRALKRHYRVKVNREGRTLLRWAAFWERGNETERCRRFESGSASQFEAWSSDPLHSNLVRLEGRALNNLPASSVSPLLARSVRLRTFSFLQRLTVAITLHIWHLLSQVQAILC